ncbi:LOW QUALITY PROTEIN: hypothetical protein ACHAXR_008252 [Thalassiosira sp. AJA248-18]
MIPALRIPDDDDSSDDESIPALDDNDSSDDESVDDEAIFDVFHDDHAPERWSAACSTTPAVNRVTAHWTSFKEQWLDALHADYPFVDIPPGSTLDLPPPRASINQLVSAVGDSICDLVEDEAYDIDYVVPIRCDVRAVGINQDSSQVCRLDDKGLMSDTGANVSVKETAEGLLNVHDIDPVPVGLALTGDTSDTSHPPCTQMGYLPLLREDGTQHLQPFLINPAASETIMSPDSVLHSSAEFAYFKQVGYKGNHPGFLQFFSFDDTLLLQLELRHHNGLYYCPITSILPDSYTIDSIFTNPVINHLQTQATTTLLPHQSEMPPPRSAFRKHPTNPARHLESELWAARLGHCGEWQLDVLPGCATGIPNQFDYHPFRFIDHREQARIRRQAKGRLPDKVRSIGQRFYMDFGFIRASTSDFSRPNPKEDRIVESFDGYNCYLLVVDEKSRHLWVFMFQSKEPPVDDASDFLSLFGLPEGGIIRCDQGGELAACKEFVTRMKRDHNYIVEPTGADSPSQNGGVERWNNTLATTVRALLYGASLEAKYWSVALVHAVFVHNRRVHSSTKKTPFEGWFGRLPDLSRLKLFGARVCVKRSGKRRAKLDRHDFRGIFLGYTATDHNIRYIDLDSGLVKSCHHAVYDEAWYLQPSRPPAAQLLYDLGLVEDSDFTSSIIDQPIDVASYPPSPATYSPFTHKIQPAIQLPLPLRLTDTPPSVTARAAKLERPSTRDPYADTALAPTNPDSKVVDEFGITRRDIAQIYVSPHPYHDAFEEDLDLRRFSACRPGDRLEVAVSVLPVVLLRTNPASNLRLLCLCLPLKVNLWKLLTLMLLFVRSVMWDLGVPQCSASIAYEDNDACTAMANAQKPTPRARHMDIKHRVLCEWVERDLIKLERVDTTLNMADHFTKQLGPLLFYRHTDYILGHVPPQYSHCFQKIHGMLRDRKKQQTTTFPVPKSALDVTPAPLAAAAARFVVEWSKVTAYYVPSLPLFL